MKKIKSKEGDIFVIPLRSSGYGIGLIARKNKSLMLGYFWGKKFNEIPEKIDLNKLKRNDIIWVIQFGSRGLDKGDWEILGTLPEFKKEEWEVPPFISDVAPFGKYLVTYNDKLEEISKVKIPNDSDTNYPENGVAGYGFVEIKLTELLNDIEKQ